MARKKIREHDGKRMLRKYLAAKAGISIPVQTVLVHRDTDWKKLAEQNPWLHESKLVAKPDMLFGKRGKHNLVLLKASLDDARKFVEDHLAKEVEISGVKGPLTHWLLEPFVPHTEEYYLSIQSHGEHDEVHFSVAGGIHVEENWEKVKHLHVPMDKGIDGVDLEAGLGLAEVPESRRAQAVAFVKGVYKAFVELDFVVLELNPFTFNEKGEVVPLDLVAEVDDCALFKNVKNWEGLEFPAPFGKKLCSEEERVHEMDAKTGASLKLTVLNPQGRLWLMVAGGGASVIFADTVADLGYGPELGNYGEYSGNPNEEETYNYARTILELATRGPDGRRRALLIGGGIANFTDVAKTFKGIIHALEEFKDRLVKANMAIYVRRAGPNYQTGLKMMKALGEKLGVPVEVYGPEIPMTSIIPKAIAYLKDGK